MTTSARAQLGDLLEQVAKSLDIPAELHEEAVRKYEEVGHWLEEKDMENGRREPQVYPQGSFRLGTVIRPISDKDEYDIDLVYERDLRKESISQKKLKHEAGEHLSSFVEYLKESHREAPKLEEGSRCWTLEYPDQFHMDMLPAIPNDEGRAAGGVRAETKILITDKGLHEWQHSNPIGYAEWFKEQMKVQFLEKRAAIAREELLAKGAVLNDEMVKAAAEQVPEYKVKTPLQRAIQILKRHRDFHFQEDKDNRPASIILNTLAAKAYSNEGNLVDALLNLARRMPEHIEQRYEKGKLVPWVPNPVNDDENFADRWQDEEHPDREDKFRAWLKKVNEDIAAALLGGGIHKVVNLLGISLGQSIVTKAAADLGHGLRQQSQSSSLGMTTGTGAIVTGAGASDSTTPVRRHTFYGDDHNEGT